MTPSWPHFVVFCTYARTYTFTQKFVFLCVFEVYRKFDWVIPHSSGKFDIGAHNPHLVEQKLAQILHL